MRTVHVLLCFFFLFMGSTRMHAASKPSGTAAVRCIPAKTLPLHVQAAPVVPANAFLAAPNPDTDHRWITDDTAVEDEEDDLIHLIGFECIAAFPELFSFFYRNGPALEDLRPHFKVAPAASGQAQARYLFQGVLRI